jgi:hypothetical protein
MINFWSTRETLQKRRDAKGEGVMETRVGGRKGRRGQVLGVKEMHT